MTGPLRYVPVIRSLTYPAWRTGNLIYDWQTAMDVSREYCERWPDGWFGRDNVGEAIAILMQRANQFPLIPE